MRVCDVSFDRTSGVSDGDDDGVDADIPPSASQTTFTLVEGGTKCEQTKLVDNIGYTYAVKKSKPVMQMLYANNVIQSLPPEWETSLRSCNGVIV